MKRLTTLFLIAAGAFAQTTPATPAKSAPAPATKSGTAAATAPAGPAREPGLYAIFNTSMGTFVAKLFENETPLTVKNFAALARGQKAWKDPNTKAMVAKPMFNGITFHRVIKNFMIQTGDPTGVGNHECGVSVKDEIVPSLKFDQPGRLGMANIGAPNTGGCQFFVTTVPYPSLNGGYTLFGQVVEGQDVVNNIDNVPTGAEDKPRTPVRLISVTIKREGPAPVTAAPAKKSTTATKTGTATKSVAPATPAKK